MAGSTAITLQSGWSLANNAAMIRYKPGFNVFCFTANVRNSSAMSAGTDYTVGTLPRGFWPPYYAYSLTGLNGSSLVVRNDGVLQYRPSGAVPANTTIVLSTPWLPNMNA